jgi:hypothetical protein
MLFNTFTSFLGIASSGYINTVLMRQSELKTGIDLMDKDGTVLGKSKIIANSAINQTAISRVGLAAPIFIPALFMMSLQKFNIYPQARVAQFVLSQVLMFSELYFCVPVGCAMFPSLAKVDRSLVEPEF